MMNLDLKDRKILYQLDINSRQKASQIGKKVHLPKNVINYRIKKLLNKGIIKNFYTIIDSYKLGYIGLRINFIYQNISPEIEQDIIEEFLKLKCIWEINSIKGKYDLIIVLWIKNINEFYGIWQEILSHYEKYFFQKSILANIQLFLFRNSYLLPENNKRFEREFFDIIGGNVKIKIDDIDLKILNLLALNARIPLVRIAEQLNCSSKMVNYRIKSLKKLKVIIGFKTSIDITRFSLKLFKVDIRFLQPKKISQIINYIKYNPNLVFITKTVGNFDLEIAFHLENSNILITIMEDIMKHFPGVIRNYQYYQCSICHKRRFLPEF